MDFYTIEPNLASASEKTIICILILLRTHQIGYTVVIVTLSHAKPSKCNKYIRPPGGRAAVAGVSYVKLLIYLDDSEKMCDNFRRHVTRVLDRHPETG